MVYRVTFVCTGNICRSPVAEHILRRHLADEGLAVEVDSSGTGGWHLGNGADRRSVAALGRRGYTSTHRAQRFEASWFDRYDLIIALDRGHLRELRSMAASDRERDKVRLLREFDPEADGPDVPDPYYGGEADFELVLDQVEAAVPGLVAKIRQDLKET
ncbi:MAG: low molecular weight protein-tyrosine-phosphatase [Streptosporangiaceae bacterium]